MDGTILHIMGEVGVDDAYVSDSDPHGECSDFIFDCGDELYEGLMFLQPHETNSQTGPSTTSSSRDIPETWLLLDSQSTIDVLCNGDLLTDIQKSENCLRIQNTLQRWNQED